MATKDDILALLRRDRRTVTELARELGLARTAVVQPLQQLESEGLVEGTIRREKRAGKPAMEYLVAPGQEDINSVAYPSFAGLLASAVAEQMSGPQLERLMQSVGHKLAAELDVPTAMSASARLKAATNFVDSLGADTTTEKNGNQTVVRSYSCPLARAVRSEPCVCKAVSTFLSEVTGAEVEQKCERGDRLVCTFVVAV